MSRSGCFILVIVLATMAQGAWAHRYIHNDGSHLDADTALDVGDIEISTVVYHTAPAGKTELWLRFDAEAGQRASIQIGVPYIDRYRDYRPAFALLGPGLEEVALPFQTPEGYGAFLFTTDGIASPDVFNEEFTGTISWTFEMQHIILPETGRYYIVGFVPSNEAGKYWIAPGTREYFSLADILILPYVIYKVRTFHEVFPFGGILAWGMLGLAVTVIALLMA